MGATGGAGGGTGGSACELGAALRLLAAVDRCMSSAGPLRGGGPAALRHRGWQRECLGQHSLQTLCLRSINIDTLRLQDCCSGGRLDAFLPSLRCQVGKPRTDSSFVTSTGHSRFSIGPE